MNKKLKLSKKILPLTLISASMISTDANANIISQGVKGILQKIEKQCENFEYKSNDKIDISCNFNKTQVDFHKKYQDLNFNIESGQYLLRYNKNKNQRDILLEYKKLHARYHQNNNDKKITIGDTNNMPLIPNANNYAKTGDNTFNIKYTPLN